MLRQRRFVIVTQRSLARCSVRKYPEAAMAAVTRCRAFVQGPWLRDTASPVSTNKSSAGAAVRSSANGRSGETKKRSSATADDIGKP